MSINVYWTCLEKEWERAEEPEPVIKRLFNYKKPDIENPMNNTMLCPSVASALNNTFAIKSIYDYEFTIVEDKLGTNYYDYEFFDNHVIIRDIEKKFFSFQQKFLFFTDEDSLEMEAYLFPFAENNEVVRRTFSIPGKFNIGKWFRNLEFNFYLREEYDTFSIRSGDAYTYIKFDTPEKINFRQFYMSPKLWQYIYRVADLRMTPSKEKRSLPDFYNMMNFKDEILEEIKINLI